MRAPLPPVGDTQGVTNHTVTITGLWPGQNYKWGVQSHSIVEGTSCGHSYSAFSKGGKSTAMSKPPAGAFTYRVVPSGPTYVTQGKGIYFQIEYQTLTGAYTSNRLTTTLTGLPPFTSVSWVDPQIWQNTADTVSAANGVTFDTIKIHEYYAQEPYVRTNIGGTTPVGDYTITITTHASDNSDTPPTVVATWPIHVVSSATPFSGIAFPYGTPSSYPSIPNLALFKTNADVYGETTCAQDPDPLPARTRGAGFRPNNPATVQIPATCCTYGSWFYDGIQAYYNVENMLQNGKNWALCRANVKDNYRDKYILPAKGNVWSFMRFSKGFYTDYLRTGDVTNLTVIDSYVAHSRVPWHGVAVNVDYLQRESPYEMRNFIHAILLGQSGTQYKQSYPFMRDYWMEHVLGQIDQICLSQNADYFENFMMGLQAESLIEYYNFVNQDQRIPPAIACLADWMYTNQWQKNMPGMFPYDKYQFIMQITQADTGSCMVTLNNMISPMYAWLFKLTGNSIYQNRGDEIFKHGVLFDGCNSAGAQSFLNFPVDSGGKNYSQQYSWGTEYVNWRSAPTDPRVYFYPSTVNFADQNVETTGSAQTISVSNAGGTNLNVTSASVSGAFVLTDSGTCHMPFTLAPGQGCTFVVTFSPTSATTYNGQLTISGNATGSPHSVTLFGTGKN